jgi:Xaa-Pro aminopeptidase
MLTESADWSYPTFTLAERETRWAKVRTLMARDGVDVTVCLPCSNSHNRGAADARYLTQLGDNADEITVCFPVSGDVTVWVSGEPARPSSNWLVDIRSAGGETDTVLIQQLKELRLERAKIGIAGLTGGVLGHCREAEGEANWHSVELIRQALPHARIISATDLLGEARYQKSDEEIEFLRRGTQLAERVVETVRRTARPGVRERHVFAEMMFTSALEGGSFTPMFGWISGPRGDVYHRVEQPSFRSFETGDVLVIEVDGRWGGYISQIDQTFSLGPLHPDTRDALALTMESFNRVMERLKPGVSVAELVEAANRKGMNGRGVARLGMHGRGTGDDGPLVIPNTTPETQRALMQENAVLCLKPGTAVDGKQYAATWSDAVVVTKQGGVRLGSRPPIVIELG